MVCKKMPSSLVMMGAMTLTSWARLAIGTSELWRRKPCRNVVTASASASVYRSSRPSRPSRSRNHTVHSWVSHNRAHPPQSDPVPVAPAGLAAGDQLDAGVGPGHDLGVLPGGLDV